MLSDISVYLAAGGHFPSVTERLCDFWRINKIVTYARRQCRIRHWFRSAILCIADVSPMHFKVPYQTDRETLRFVNNCMHNAYNVAGSQKRQCCPSKSGYPGKIYFTFLKVTKRNEKKQLRMDTLYIQHNVHWKHEDALTERHDYVLRQ